MEMYGNGWKWMYSQSQSGYSHYIYLRCYMHLVINGKVLLIVLIGHIAPALKGSLIQVKSRREDEHLAQLDLIQLDLSENSFFIGKRESEGENGGSVKFQIMKNHYTTVLVLLSNAKKIFWDIYFIYFMLSNVPI